MCKRAKIDLTLSSRRQWRFGFRVNSLLINRELSFFPANQGQKKYDERLLSFHSPTITRIGIHVTYQLLWEKTTLAFKLAVFTLFPNHLERRDNLSSLHQLLIITLAMPVSNYISHRRAYR